MCIICEHEHREEIENALYKMNSQNANKLIDRIAAEYDVAAEDLKRHALFHTSLMGVSDESDDEIHDSIVRQIKMREADVLSAIVLDQATTVKVLGKRIRKAAEGEELRLEKTLTKPMVDLYNGSSDSLRKNIQALTDINQLVNGPKDNGLSGLAALAQVLDASRRRSEDDDDD